MELSAIEKRSLQLSAPLTHPPFQKVAVLGAGTMGAQIAAHLANTGVTVHLLDLASDNGDPLGRTKKSLEQAKRLSPDPFFTDDTAHGIALGTFEHDFDRLKDVDWVIEAVVERLDVKRDLMKRIEETVGAETVISTNTSGIPIHEIGSERSDTFKSRFLGTHFFNPPRYLKLLELIPTPATSRKVVERVAQFGRIHLGKGIVLANDVPYFIGNRIGVYGQLQAIRYITEGDYTIEEVDELTGPLVGRPRSATFRTADLVGLDVLLDVAQNLYEKLPDDPQRNAFQVPELIKRLVEAGAKGAKSGAGFYKKEDGVIKSVNAETLNYEQPQESQMDLTHVKEAGSLPDRLRVLFDDDGKAGRFFRETMADLMAYSANRVGEVTDNPAEIDRAIKWGFGWEIGPFETWEILGHEQVIHAIDELNLERPRWVDQLPSDGFYTSSEDIPQVYVPHESTYREDADPADELKLDRVKGDPENVLWENDEAVLVDIGDSVALFEFRSKANTLGRNVMSGLREAIRKVERDPDIRGLVIGNEGKNFSVGANLGEVAHAVQAGAFDRLDQFLKGFQQTIQQVRYATKPVVVATHQRVLGGGCEMAMACPNPVASSETYIGLVELGVGVIPAGTGCMRLAAQASRRAPSSFPSHVQPFLQKRFEQIAKAEVAESAVQAIEMGYLPDHTRVIMNADRRLHVARSVIYQLSEEGYRPPVAESQILALGRPTRAAFEVALQQYHDGNYISDYDQYLGKKLAYVLTGGELTTPQKVNEEYLLDLEREVFLSLLGEEKTQQRIQHMLKKGKPLRN